MDKIVLPPWWIAGYAHGYPWLGVQFKPLLHFYTRLGQSGPGQLDDLRYVKQSVTVRHALGEKVKSGLAPAFLRTAAILEVGQVHCVNAFAFAIWFLFGVCLKRVPFAQSVQRDERQVRGDMATRGRLPHARRGEEGPRGATGDAGRRGLRARCGRQRRGQRCRPRRHGWWPRLRCQGLVQRGHG